jgi:hypothetical protein
MRRQRFSSFNLAFLDIMFCGFGAVVLLVLIINANAVKAITATHQDLRAEVMRVQREVQARKKYLVELKNTLAVTEQEIVQARGSATKIVSQTETMEQQKAAMQLQTLARKEHVNTLQSDLKTLDEQQHRLGAEQQADQDSGNKIRRFQGAGHRQYLTGLKLGGKRVLILLDMSASMLDKSIVNVIRRRNMSDALKRSSRKWQRAVKTVQWLVANLPRQSKLQIYVFNTKTLPLLAATKNRWIPVTDRPMLNKMILALQQKTPEQGTSLINAFTAAAALKPKPDNILLITDGLPTQGKSKSGQKVTGEQRLDLFTKAVKKLPSGVQVNTILLPMEGDPMAAVMYWKLALQTHGSFFTPSRDWP